MLESSAISLIEATTPAKADFRFAAAVQPRVLRDQMPPGQTAPGLTPHANLNIIRFYFRRLCATLGGKQER